MIKILGAGMAGLLAANMLRKHDPRIFEIKRELPHNHGALLRFRSKSVSDATCIDFKEVLVSKNIYYLGEIYNKTNILMNNMYSKRVTKTLSSRSITNLDNVNRYIAPDNFIESCASGLDIKTDVEMSLLGLNCLPGPTISTIPMPALMKLLNYDDLDNTKFDYRSITSFRIEIKNIPCDLYQTYYIPSEADSVFYRVSISCSIAIFETNEIIINEEEIINSEIPELLFELFGIQFSNCGNVSKVFQKYGKLISTDKKYARRFISWATKNHNFYSLGRFSTWRQILMDDCVNDVKVIEKLIKTENYER